MPQRPVPDPKEVYFILPYSIPLTRELQQEIEEAAVAVDMTPLGYAMALVYKDSLKRNPFGIKLLILSGRREKEPFLQNLLANDAGFKLWYLRLKKKIRGEFEG